jgi:hypothetical protein
MDRTSRDGLDLRVRLFLALIGAALAIAGWYQFFRG